MKTFAGVRPFVALLATTSLLGSCREQGAAPGQPSTDVLATVRSGVISFPDSIPPGWSRLRVEEDGLGHILVAFRIPASIDAPGFLAALDTAPATPSPGIALGGPEVGDVGDVIIHFTSGFYVLGCVRRGDDGHRHASTGESKVFVVTSASVDSTRDTPPAATHELQMADFAYVGPDTWTAGSQMLRIENTGTEDHQLRLVRLNNGSTITQWMKDGAKHGIAVAGLARMGPGQVAYLPLELPAGNYVALCLVTSAAKHAPHVELGMLRAITVR